MGGIGESAGLLDQEENEVIENGFSHVVPLKQLQRADSE